MHWLYCLYSTEEKGPGEQAGASGDPTFSGRPMTPGEFLSRFGERVMDERMEAAYGSAAGQMPTLLDRRPLTTVRVRTPASDDPMGELLSESPDNDLAVLRGIILCLTIHLEGDLDRLVGALRATTFQWQDLVLDGMDMVTAASGMDGARPAMEVISVGSDVHHVVRADPSVLEIFIDGQDGWTPGIQGSCPVDVNRQAVTQVVVRSTTSLRLDFSEVLFPVATNRVPGTLAAVGPAVTLLARQPLHVESWILWSAIHLTCSLSRVRQIRREAYETLDEMERGLRAERQHQGDYSLARRHLISLSRRLGRLELELAPTGWRRT